MNDERSYPALDQDAYIEEMAQQPIAVSEVYLVFVTIILGNIVKLYDL